MKRAAIFILFALVMQLQLWSQEPVLFNIYFIDDEPPQASFLPRGGGILNGTDFSSIVYLDGVSPLSGRLLTLTEDNLFEPVSSMEIVFAGYPPDFGGGGGSGGAAFSIEKVLSLTEAQIENLLAGKWYAEIVFQDATYLGQFSVIPEPTVVLFLACGLAIGFGCSRQRRIKL